MFWDFWFCLSIFRKQQETHRKLRLKPCFSGWASETHTGSWGDKSGHLAQRTACLVAKWWKPCHSRGNSWQNMAEWIRNWIRMDQKPSVSACFKTVTWQPYGLHPTIEQPLQGLTLWWGCACHVQNGSKWIKTEISLLRNGNRFNRFNRFCSRFVPDFFQRFQCDSWIPVNWASRHWDDGRHGDSWCSKCYN